MYESADDDDDDDDVDDEERKRKMKIGKICLDLATTVHTNTIQKIT